MSNILEHNIDYKLPSYMRVQSLSDTLRQDSDAVIITDVHSPSPARRSAAGSCCCSKSIDEMCRRIEAQYGGTG